MARSPCRAGFLLSAALFCGGSAAAGTSPPIPNGIATPWFPSVVGLSANGKIFCSGTAIGPDVVLTAAHCLVGEPGVEVFSGGALFKTDGSMFHPAYDPEATDLRQEEFEAIVWRDDDEPTQRRALDAARRFLREVSADLAVLRLAPGSRLPAHTAVRVRGDPTRRGFAVTLVGFGMNDSVDRTGVGTKRYGDNQVDGQAEGVLISMGARRNSIRPFDGTVSIATGRDVGIESGDSGGPMIENGAVIGVNVFRIRRDFAGAEALSRVVGAAIPPPSQQWALTVSPAHPANAAFLRRAAEQGYGIAFDGGPPPARDPMAPRAAKAPGRSATLDRLEKDPGF